MKRKLTLKQEKFCREYIKNGGNASDAYRAAYNTDRLKTESVNRLAFDLLHNIKIASRIEALRKAAQKRNDISLDRVLKEIAAVAFVDPSDIFQADGTLKPLDDMDEKSRRAIAGIKRKEVTGDTSEVTIEAKLLDKLSALEKLMKHLGGYERDNKQKADSVIVVGAPQEFGDGDNG